MNEAAARSAVGRGTARRVFALLLCVLLVLALRWHVPMMLWDHLDLVPMLQAAQAGDWAGSGLFSLHGGHVHLTGYLPLLATALWFPRAPWLDVILSVLLLAATAWLLWRGADRLLPPARHRWRALWPLGLLLHPGHLANLQWGWQVAVFVCLLGVAMTLTALGGQRVGVRQLVTALVGTWLAACSFATGIALVPVAIGMLVLRTELSWRSRIVFALPWLLTGASFALLYSRQNALPAETSGAWPLLHYTLNYLGSALARFAEASAAWWAAAALLLAVPAAWRLRHAPGLAFWLGCMAFALASAVLTAVGRVGTFGPDQAFVTRYVSFSLLFWFGWVGLLVSALAHEPQAYGLQRAARVGAVLLALLFTANGLHLAKKSAKVGRESRATAQLIAQRWPEVPDTVLAAAYFDHPEQARKRLHWLKAHGYPPFAAVSPGN